MPHIKDQFALAQPRALADDLLISTLEQNSNIPSGQHSDERRQAVDATVRFLQAGGGVFVPSNCTTLSASKAARVALKR
eukprot:8511987-Alexandrium_andersonii.AAC.1